MHPESQNAQQQLVHPNQSHPVICPPPALPMAMTQHPAAPTATHQNTSFEATHQSAMVVHGPGNSNLHATTEHNLDGSSEHTPHLALDNNGNDGIPEVMSSPQQPFKLMRFDTLEEAEKHYKVYARRKGFGVRYDYRRKSEVHGKITRASLVCHRAGKNAKDKEDTQKPQPIVKQRRKNTTVRTDCAAQMIVKHQNNSWVVTEFNDDHNHPLIAKWSLTGYLRSHRHIPDDEKEFIKMLHACNLETSRQMQILAELHGCLDNVPYTVKDVANYRASLRLEHRLTDMQDTMTYFEKMRTEDKDFYYKFQLDDEDRLQNLYWIDGAARRAFKFFNDCISFDTTYMTNIYKMPCAPFIGINSHGQSIQFGCGFLRNELITSFVWLFESFLEAMGGLPPANIITDQDFAMRNAIDQVFPAARHRNCRWHIMKKATEKLGSFFGRRPQLHAEFEDCINNSLSVEEFDQKWNSMIQRQAVGDNEELANLFDKRSWWVPAYFTHDFYPFLQSTQRSEGFNAVLKKYVNPQNSIYDFVQQYAAIQEKIMTAEDKQEADTAITVPSTWCRHPIEVQMAKVYTRNIYYRFQAEMHSSMSYNCQHIGNNMYSLVSIVGFVPQYGTRTYQVAADVQNKVYSCQCCKFERDGILCCHILKVMVQLGVTEIPQPYVLKRWTWDAKEVLYDPKIQPDVQQHEMPDESRIRMRLAVMCSQFTKLVREACVSEDGIRIATSHMKEMKNELATLKRSQERKRARTATAAPASTPAPVAAPDATTKTAAPTSSSAASHASNTGTLRDPPKSNTKGRKKRKAYKHPLDIVVKEKKTCRLCGSTEHDARTCSQRASTAPTNTM